MTLSDTKLRHFIDKIKYKSWEDLGHGTYTLICFLWTPSDVYITTNCNPIIVADDNKTGILGITPSTHFLNLLHKTLCGPGNKKNLWEIVESGNRVADVLKIRTGKRGRPPCPRVTVLTLKQKYGNKQFQEYEFGYRIINDEKEKKREKNKSVKKKLKTEN